MPFWSERELSDDESEDPFLIGTYYASGQTDSEKVDELLHVEKKTYKKI
ncbi:MAG: hypothetical protein ACLFQB_01670 [Chitinispirillaceae bacterium]